MFPGVPLLYANPALTAKVLAYHALCGRQIVSWRTIQGFPGGGWQERVGVASLDYYPSWM